MSNDHSLGYIATLSAAALLVMTGLGMPATASIAGAIGDDAIVRDADSQSANSVEILFVGPTGKEKPVVLEAPKPRYPQQALDDNKEGWVIVELDVSPAGQADNVRVVEHSGTNMFNVSAKRALRKYRFSATDAAATHKSIRYKIRYQLHGAS